MARSTAGLPRPTPRRLILGTAFLLALAFSLPPKVPTAIAQDARTPAGTSGVPAEPAPPSSPPAAAPSLPSPPAPPAAAPPPAKRGVDAGSRGISIKIEKKDTPDSSDDDEEIVEKDDAKGTITIRKNGKTFRVTGLPPDREFESVNQFVHAQPALASVVLGIVAVVFFAPVLAIAIVIWYRVRRTRMLNETMLKLAERGVIAPSEALEAIAAGRMPPRAADGSLAGGNLAALQSRASAARHSVAWSDMRKGVIMGAVGLAITLYSLFEDRSPNVLGLVLLFVGIGYAVLWWFEERQISPEIRADVPAVSRAGSPDEAGSAGRGASNTGPGGAA